jgi:hypothetical protein
MSEAAVVLEGLIAARYNRDVKAHRMGPDYISKQSRILEAATRHYLAAVRELARVRKQQVGAPGDWPWPSPTARLMLDKQEG